MKLTAKYLRNMPKEHRQQKIQDFVNTISQDVLTYATNGKTKLVWIFPTNFEFYYDITISEIIDACQEKFVDCEIIKLTTTSTVGHNPEVGIQIDWSEK